MSCFLFLVSHAQNEEKDILVDVFFCSVLLSLLDQKKKKRTYALFKGYLKVLFHLIDYISFVLFLCLLFPFLLFGFSYLYLKKKKETIFNYICLTCCLFWAKVRMKEKQIKTKQKATLR